MCNTSVSGPHDQWKERGCVVAVHSLPFPSPANCKPSHIQCITPEIPNKNHKMVDSKSSQCRVCAHFGGKGSFWCHPSILLLWLPLPLGGWVSWTGPSVGNSRRLKDHCNCTSDLWLILVLQWGMKNLLYLKRYSIIYESASWIWRVYMLWMTSSLWWLTLKMTFRYYWSSRNHVEGTYCYYPWGPHTCNYMHCWHLSIPPGARQYPTSFDSTPQQTGHTYGLHSWPSEDCC